MFVTTLFILVIGFALPDDPSLQVQKGEFGDSKLTIEERQDLYLNPDGTLKPEKLTELTEAIVLQNRRDKEDNRNILETCAYQLTHQELDKVILFDFEDVAQANIDERCLWYLDAYMPSIKSKKAFHELANSFAKRYDWTQVPIVKINLFLMTVRESLTVLRLCKWLALAWQGPDTLGDYFNSLRYLPPDPRMRYRVRHPVVGPLMKEWLFSKGLTVKKAWEFMEMLYDTKLTQGVLNKIYAHRQNVSTLENYLEEVNNKRLEIILKAENPQLSKR